MHRNARILNGRLAEVITTLRYGESIVVADAGLPLPAGTPTIDLALVPGQPTTRQVVAAIKGDCVVLEVRIASQASTVNPGLRTDMLALFDGLDVVREVDHMEGIEAELTRTRMVVQTGEVSPYGNVVLIGGLDFFDISMAGASDLT